MFVDVDGAGVVGWVKGEINVRTEPGKREKREENREKTWTQKKPVEKVCVAREKGRKWEVGKEMRFERNVKRARSL